MENSKRNSDKVEELIKKYNIDLEKLKQEQLKLAKEININDKIDFSLADKFGAIDNVFIQNKILSCIIVCDKNFEIVERVYAFEKARFPYIPGFRNYRELETMMIAFEKLTEKPDVVFVPAQGISHPRLGLASHFGLFANVPTIGVSNSVFGFEAKGKDGEDILKENKKVGNVLISKPGSKPMFISPGYLISIKSAYELSKNLINLPHKRPEPLHLAGKYAKEVRKELI